MQVWRKNQEEILITPDIFGVKKKIYTTVDIREYKKGGKSILSNEIILK